MATGADSEISSLLKNFMDRMSKMEVAINNCNMEIKTITKF